MNKFSIEENNIGLRLDTFLVQVLKDRSRAYIQKAIEEGLVLVNDKKSKSSYKLRINDEVSFTPLKEETLEIIESNIPLDIIYEDDDIIVINKPRGMVVHPSNGHYEGGTLVNALMYRKESLSSINGIIRPGIVHRLDKDTSGLIVVAKNDEAHIFLAKQLLDKTMYREYYALCEGIIGNNEVIIKAPIGKDPSNRLRNAVDVINGKEAITHVHVLKRYKDACFISCKLETGRTHQIRVHLSYINHPLIGDTLYGKKNQPLTNKGQMLHAYCLSFIHPKTNKRVTFYAELDTEFIRVQNLLK